MVDEDKKKISVSLSINKSLHGFFKGLTSKVIEIDGKKIHSSRTVNEMYNRALEYAIENINEWDK